MNAASPTANITCPHGRLAPDVSTATKRTAVSADVWQDLQDLWCAGRRQAAIRAAQKAARQAVQQQREGQQEQQPEQQRQQQQQQEEEGHEQHKPGGGMSSDDGLEIVGEVIGNGAAPSTPTAAAQQPPPSPAANGAAEAECVAFPVSSAAPCPECSAQLRQVTQGVADARAGLEAEREALPTLVANVVEVLEPGQTYYLVPK